MRFLVVVSNYQCLETISYKYMKATLFVLYFQHFVGLVYDEGEYLCLPYIIMFIYKAYQVLFGLEYISLIQQRQILYQVNNTQKSKM